MQTPPATATNAIYLTATPTIQNGIVTAWSLCAPGGCSSGPSFPIIDFPPGPSGGTVYISINDPSNTITFAAGQGAMWVQPGFTCPGSQGWSSGNPAQLTGYQRTDGTHIQFNDANSNPASAGPIYFTYKLNFVSSNNQTVPAIDPIIRNGGKTTVKPGLIADQTVDMATLIVSLAVLVTVLFIALRLAMGRRQAPGG